MFHPSPYMYQVFPCQHNTNNNNNPFYTETSSMSGVKYIWMKENWRIHFHPSLFSIEFQILLESKSPFLWTSICRDRGINIERGNLYENGTKIGLDTNVGLSFQSQPQMCYQRTQSPLMCWYVNPTDRVFDFRLNTSLTNRGIQGNYPHITLALPQTQLLWTWMKCLSVTESVSLLRTEKKSWPPDDRHVTSWLSSLELFFSDV